jgi:hypothetical protein
LFGVVLLFAQSLVGALGDCWLMCAMAALTEFPDLVTDIIETKTVNPDGIYRVKVCKNGWWQSVRLDDYFPCHPGPGTKAGPLYSRCNGNELWVMLLEKTMAKLCGSYEAIRSGWAYEGTNAVCDCFLSCLLLVAVLVLKRNSNISRDTRNYYDKRTSI